VENYPCGWWNFSCGIDHLLYMSIGRNSLPIRQAIRYRKANLLSMTTAIMIYTLNRMLLIPQTVGPIEYFCRCFLNDLVCPLFFLGYCQILLIWIGYEITTYKYCVLLGMAGGLVWEYVAPRINPKAVSDPMDLLFYFIGISVYYLLLRLNFKKHGALQAQAQVVS
jgi:hypothetical protein